MNVAMRRPAEVAIAAGILIVALGAGVHAGPQAPSGTWVPTGAITQPRWSPAAALLPDGRVLIAVGDSDSGVRASLEIFDPATGSFSLAGTLSSPRKSHAAAVLQDGRVLIVGGSDGTAPLSSSDIFDPGTGSVSPGP